MARAGRWLVGAPGGCDDGVVSDDPLLSEYTLLAPIGRGAMGVV